MRLQPKAKLVVNMTRYGAIFGGAAGVLSALTLILTSSSFEFLGATLPIILLEALSIATFGLVFGGGFGVLTALYSGLAMAFTTHVFFTDILSRNGYKVAMATVAAIIATLFLTSSLLHFRIDGIDAASWNGMIFMGVVMVIYSSQQVANFYLFEWNIRKQKAMI